MRVPSFWWREAGLAATLLAPPAALYGTVAAQRMCQGGREVGVAIICIGGLTVGGAGKTPMALRVERLLAATGRRPVFLTRGYGGSLAGPVTVDPTRHTAREVGDEPLLLARAAPTIVARDRVAGAEAARDAGAGIVIMDDGFHNGALAKHLAVVMIDGERGIGNARVLPAGPLRAPLGVQLERADALVVVGPPLAADFVAREFRARTRPVFHGSYVPDPAALFALAGHRVLAFAGIGHPEKFFATLEAAGIEAVVRRSFPDHHRYNKAEAAWLIAEAERRRLLLVTTEKDSVRLSGDGAVAALARCARVLPVTLVLDDEDSFGRFVLERVMQRS